MPDAASPMTAHLNRSRIGFGIVPRRENAISNGNWGSMSEETRTIAPAAKISSLSRVSPIHQAQAEAVFSP